MYECWEPASPLSQIVFFAVFPSSDSLRLSLLILKHLLSNDIPHDSEEMLH